MTGPLGINTSSSERIVNPLYYRPVTVVSLNYRLELGHVGLRSSLPHRPGRIDASPSQGEGGYEVLKLLLRRLSLDGALPNVGR